MCVMVPLVWGFIGGIVLLGDFGCTVRLCRMGGWDGWFMQVLECEGLLWEVGYYVGNIHKLIRRTWKKDLVCIIYLGMLSLSGHGTSFRSYLVSFILLEY